MVDLLSSRHGYARLPWHRRRVERTSLNPRVYGNASQHEVFQNLKTHKHPKGKLYIICAPSLLKMLKILGWRRVSQPKSIATGSPRSCGGAESTIFRAEIAKDQARMGNKKYRGCKIAFSRINPKPITQIIPLNLPPNYNNNQWSLPASLTPRWQISNTGFLQTLHVCSVVEENIYNLDSCLPTALADGDFWCGSLVTGTNTVW